MGHLASDSHVVNVHGHGGFQPGHLAGEHVACDATPQASDLERDTSQVTNMAGMLNICDTSSVTDIVNWCLDDNVFDNRETSCVTDNQPIGGGDTSQMTNMLGMFNFNSAFTLPCVLVGHTPALDCLSDFAGERRAVPTSRGVHQLYGCGRRRGLASAQSASATCAAPISDTRKSNN